MKSTPTVAFQAAEGSQTSSERTSTSSCHWLIRKASPSRKFAPSTPMLGTTRAVHRSLRGRCQTA